jgi:cell division protein ZapA
MSSVNVTINGKNYRIGCEEGQEAQLTDRAAELNTEIEKLKAAHGEIGDLRLIVMAAIKLADDLFEASRKADRLRDDMEATRQRDAASGQRHRVADAELTTAIAGAAKQIADVARRLNAAE